MCRSGDIAYAHTWMFIIFLLAIHHLSSQSRTNPEILPVDHKAIHCIRQDIFL